MGMSHCIVSIFPTSKELNEFGSISFAIFKDSDSFVREYGLVDSSSERALKVGHVLPLRVTLKGDHKFQKEYYLSNNPDLIKAIKSQDHSHIIKI
ncbi:hypothetical protein [Gracilimonas mengyeensis]|uniref:Uncharacterized protein n=1 Tax=Gracilimonas mengyeensis TaxID=1302730 RepID=A0A521D8Y2_9BACT|nr:hypothetical protein [Gracilimonas mengyeensis]SMO68075.1 hypothetical protein SAMN06265219_107213 [Gracilimonas mengyeensis]